MDIANLNKKVDLTKGEWVKDIPGEPGLELLVRSSSYKPFRKTKDALARKRAAARGVKNEYQMTIDLGEAMGEHLLLDWKGMTTSGKPVKYDTKLSLALLTADDDAGIGERFRDAVYMAAKSVADKLSEVTEEAEGN